MTRREAEHIVFDLLYGLTPEWLEGVARALSDRNILTNEALDWLDAPNLTASWVQEVTYTLGESWLEEATYALGERNILADEAMIWLAETQQEMENGRVI